MGSCEIFDRSSDESIQDIVKVETPSPLTSSHSSDSSSSLLIGIDELTFDELSHRVQKLEEESSAEEIEEQEYSKAINLTENLSDEFVKKKPDEENLSDSENISLKSSLSSLKRRLQDLPSPSEALKLADRVAALDRRIRREKNVYLQLQGLADRIEEKDEAEASSVNDSSSIPKFFTENPTKIDDARARRRANMCSSAPETMRYKKEPFDQALIDVTTSFKKPLAKKFDERRPPKYLQPLEAPIKEILRCNAPPLCLSDKKIAELLRRGSVSAREEYLKKSSNASTKFAGYKKPTGVIIKNLSSGSEEDSTSQWLIQGGSSVTKFETKAFLLGESNTRPDRLDAEEKSSIPEETSFEELKNNQQIEDREKSDSRDNPRSSQNTKTVENFSKEFKDNQRIENREKSEFCDKTRSSQNEKIVEKPSKKSKDNQRIESREESEFRDNPRSSQSANTVEKFSTESNDNQQIENREKSDFRDNPRSFQTAKNLIKSSRNKNSPLNEDTVSDDFPSSRSSKLMKTSLQSSMAQLKSVLKDLESNSRDSRPSNVPKLEIKSEEYSQSTSQASREDSTKRSLDVSALIRALSDVSIEQRKVVDHRVRSKVCDSVVSGSTEPKSSAYTSVANGSRQSMISVENEPQEPKINCSKTQHRSRGSTALDNNKKIKCVDKNSKGPSKIPIVVGETNDIVVSKVDHRELKKMARKKMAAEEFDEPEGEQTSKRVIKKITRSSPTKKSPKYQSTNSPQVKKSSVKPVNIDCPETKKSRKRNSPKTSRTEKTVQDKYFRVTNNNFQSFDSLLKNNEKQDNNAKVTVVLSEPGTSRNGRVILQDHLSSRVTSGARDILPRLLKDDLGSSDDRFKYLQRGSKIPYIRSSSSSNSSSEHEETEFKLKIIRPSANGFQSADQINSEAKFKVYEDTDEASPRPELTFPIDELNTKAASPSRKSKSRQEFHKIELKSAYVNGLPVRKDSKMNISSSEDYHGRKTLQKNDEEIPKNLRNLTKPRNIFWADSPTELKRAMNSSFESKIDVENCAILSGARSCLISPRTSSKKKKPSSSSSKNSPKIFSNRSPIGTGSSGSPRCRYEDKARLVCNNLATFENLTDDAILKFDTENIFTASAIAKRLSYSEFQAPNTKENNNEELSPEKKSFLQEEQKISSPEELIEDLASNSSQTNLAIIGRSDSTAHQFRKAFDRAIARTKISSSLSKLTRSPEEQNLAARRKSQDRFPFTISESTSAKSSSKFRAENPVQATSGHVTIEPSEMAYKLRIHPSLLRLASAGIEATAEEIIESVSHDQNIRVEPKNFVKKFVRRFSSRWRRSREQEEKLGSRSTKILYENKECRAGSAEESYGSSSAEKPGSRFNRDGLWVEGLRDETRGENEKKQNGDMDQLSDAKEQETIDRYTIFLTKREQNQRQFSRHGFTPKTPMNSLIIEEDSDVDPSCFCGKICQFLIGGNIHSRHRSSLFLRARRSKIRRF